MPITLNDVIGLGAGALVLGIGGFVLAARPASGLHRLFFLLAIADGASTLLFRLSYAAPSPSLAAYFRATYWYFFLSFIGLLAVFAILFPRPFVRPAATAVSLGIVGVAFVGAVALYVQRHDLFFTASAPDGRIVYAVGPAGNAAQIAFVAATGFLAARMTLLLLREPSPSHRRQASFVLGGMTLAYAPYAATVTAQALFDARTAFLMSRPDRVAAYWAFAVFCLGILASALLLFRETRDGFRAEKRFVLSCYAAVLGIAIGAAAIPRPEVAALLRSAALLAYPVLLGYAIARYDVFDIDRRLRRAATVSLIGIGLTTSFILGESFAESLLQNTVFRGSDFASGSAAALVTAAASVPVSRYSRKAASKFVPELTVDALHERKLEIYRHSMAGALADGILAEGESRTLAALRSSLGITDNEHARILSEVAV